MSRTCKAKSKKLDVSWTALAERSDDGALAYNEKRRRASPAAAVQIAPGLSRFN